MATRFFATTLDEFQRAFDELFDDLLIQRWRVSGAIGESEHAIVHDHADRYEVLIAIGDANPGDIDIEVSDRRLTVRVPGEPTGVAQAFSFSDPVQSDAVSAKAAQGTLAIVLPKTPRTRRVRVGQS